MKDKYDVGIYGLWYGRNYGSMITYFALDNVIRSLGYSTVMVKNPLGREIQDYSALERSHSLVFANGRYNITPLFRLNEMYKLNELCDRFLLGSDQMWNYGLSKPYGQSYFFDFVDDYHIKIAYATSFGQEVYNGPESEIPTTKKNLERFDFLSVRDKASKDILNNTFGLDSFLAMDPVFLCPRDKYEDLINEAEKMNVEKDYIFAYILDPNEKIGESIQQIAEEQNIRVYVVFNETGDKERLKSLLKISSNKVSYITEPTVQEWLFLFKNSKMVLTDSFHGSCFSIIFNKNFISLKNNGRGGHRFVHLLSMVDLMNHMIETPSDFYTKYKEIGIDGEIDYERVNNKIQEENEKSLLWLREALSAKKDKGPYYGTTTYENKKTEVYDVCSHDKCTGCSACANVCPVNVIEMTMDREGFLYPIIIDEDKCIKCKLCEKTCPVLNPVKKIVENKNPIKVFAAYSLDEETRYMSTSGGAFSEFAKYILENNGVCYGAVYDENFVIRHKRIDNFAGLKEIRQSKYYQSHIDDTFKSVKLDLDQGKKVLFCGSPCQTAGLSGYLKKDYKNLLIVDFICHSVSSERAFMAYLKEMEEKHGSKAERIWFKNKETGWHKFSQRIDFTGKNEYYCQPWYRDSYMKGFLNFKCYQRPSCHSCNFKAFHRSSDITLADFWGLTWNNQEQKDDQEKGVSVVIVNTAKGKKIFDKHISSRVYSEEHQLKEIPPKNGGLYSCQNVGKYRDYFFECLDNEVPFSKIIGDMEKNEKWIKEHSTVTNVNVNSGNSGKITGKLTKIGNVVIDMHPTAKIIINGELICNSRLPKGSQKECVLILHENATLRVNGRFGLAYDTVLQIFKDGTLTLGNGSTNAGTVFAIKRNTVFGDGFLGGRNCVYEDSDFHRVIDLDTNTVTNMSKSGIKIGKHVWCAEGVKLLKDINVGDNSVVAAGSIVTKDVPNNSLVAGIPAKVIKTNINWEF